MWWKKNIFNSNRVIYPAARRPRCLRVESLEGRLAPATLVSPTVLTYQDVDGDRVTVTSSRPIFNAGTIDSVFRFSPAGVTGVNTQPQQLQVIDLVPVAEAAGGTSLTVTAARSAANGGNGFANVGRVSAAVDLGAVVIKGDLGRITAGDGNAATAGLRSLTVQSLGRFGIATQGAGDLHTLIQGRLGALTVKSDIVEADVAVTGGADGTTGSIRVGGSLVGGVEGLSGGITSTGSMGAVTVG